LTPEELKRYTDQLDKPVLHGETNVVGPPHLKHVDPLSEIFQGLRHKGGQLAHEAREDLMERTHQPESEGGFPEDLSTTLREYLPGHHHRHQPPPPPRNVAWRNDSENGGNAAPHEVVLSSSKAGNSLPASVASIVKNTAPADFCSAIKVCDHPEQTYDAPLNRCLDPVCTEYLFMELNPETKRCEWNELVPIGFVTAVVSLMFLEFVSHKLYWDVIRRANRSGGA